ncbi:UDP-N-acetylglucosamine--N-acetylmuramyl-(pentapeptide) pyrophosphoryl-undecaprenol N-acetylglucosamine transferase [Tsukamurella sp. TY48]|nr:UDP-N-acetylglucosamine--N-acetylmuramyl-(pentapeptide) pyrophosphoryl-undecaprenol N-acetylglucosamine transferase [Tsukamurella sp. TY48]GIZ96711.1 UDP-N-acetylglucosamine--N-acetylmuramyl-(pentapeptide) pyrophosphoryl-undecaprenol N-acetylglucosamine transferase [Tsukamurella sp. TY48]
MTPEAPPRIVVAGGHSAGHIEPAMNLADAIRRREPAAAITALGTVRGLDTALIPARGYPLALIAPVPLPRSLGVELLRTPGRLAAAVRAAGAVLDRTGAEVAVGFGGYVALPAYLAARRRGIPILVHEANAFPGIANRIGARLTDRVFTAVPGVRLPHATVLGIPLRPEIAALNRGAVRAAARGRFGLRADGPVLLVTGGSQGAETINAAASAAAPALLRAGVQVLHITGPGRDVPPSGPGYVAVPYVDAMRYAYAAADLAICRAGAMTCAELAAVGLPAAYVPLPLRGGEQWRNAEPAVAAGGGVVIDDAALDAAWIERTLVPLLLAPDRIAAMADRAASVGAADAGDLLAVRALDAVRARRAGAPRPGGHRRAGA